MGCGICQLPGEAGFAKIWAPMWGWERKRFLGWRRRRKWECGIRTPPSRPWPPGGRGTPLDKPYRYVPPQRVGFFEPFWSENRYRLCPFWSGIGYDFRGNFLNYGNVWTRVSFEFQICKKESKISELEVDCFEIGSGFWELGGIPPPPLPTRISRSTPSSSEPWPDYQSRKQMRKNFTSNSSEQCTTKRFACNGLVLPLQYYQPRDQ